MRKKRKPEEHGFNVWRSYSDMMAGVLLLSDHVCDTFSGTEELSGQSEGTG